MHKPKNGSPNNFAPTTDIQRISSNICNIHNRSNDKKVTKVSLRESPEIDAIALADSNNIIFPCEYKYDSFQCLAAKN